MQIVDEESTENEKPKREKRKRGDLYLNAAGHALVGCVVALVAGIIEFILVVLALGNATGFVAFVVAVWLIMIFTIFAPIAFVVLDAISDWYDGTNTWWVMFLKVRYWYVWLIWIAYQEFIKIGFDRVE